MKSDVTLVPNNIDVIAFHANCPDGWCAAFIAQQKYPGASLLPVSYGEKTSMLEFQNKDVLVVDFSWPRATAEIFCGVAKSFIIYDHHKTAQKELDGLDYVVFDMERSGAGITCDMLNAGFRPWFVDYVEDRDLWRFKLPDSREVNAYLMALPQTEEAWTALYDMSVAAAATLGRAIRLHINHYIEKVSANHVIGNFFGHKTAVVNAPYVNISDVCEKLLEYGDVGMGWFQRTDGLIQFSLRSRGDLDVSAVAKIFGGGGHKSAAGFQLPIVQARMLIDSFPAHS